MPKDLFEEYNIDFDPPVAGIDLFEKFNIISKKPRFLERQDRQGIPGIAKDVGEGIYEGVTNIPSMIEPLGKTIGYGAAQAKNNPKRFAQNMGGALAEYGAQVGNLPEAFANYYKSRGLMKGQEDEDLYNSLVNLVPREPRPFDPNESTLQRIGRSIHLPKPGKFNYAEALGRAPAQFQEEEQADQLLNTVAPTAIAGLGGISSIMAQQLGAEENPFTPLALPAGRKAIKTVGEIPGVIKEGAKKVIGFKGAPEIRANAAEAAKTMADKIAIEDLNNFKKTGGDMYTSLIEDTTNKGISKAKITKQFAGDFFKESTRKESTAVKKAFQTSEIKDIHDAYIDLGKYISRQSKKQLMKPERAALDQARALRKNMKGALQDAFSKAGGTEFADRFDKANKYWAENVVTNETNALLNKYRSGKLTAEDLIKKASNNETFRAQLAKKYPELMEYAQALEKAEKLGKPKPTTPEAVKLERDVKRNQLVTETPKKLGNVVTKTTGLGGILNWLTK